MKKTTMRMLVIMLLLLMSSIGASISAQEGETEKNAQMRNGTISGEVICTVCFTRHDSRGKDHVDCALHCAEQGIPLGILDEASGEIYLPLPEGHSDPNKVLKDYIAKVVTATGTIYEKWGLKQIEVEKIEVKQ